MAGRAAKLRKRIARKAHRLEMVTETPKVLIGTPCLDTVLSEYTRCAVHCVAYSLSQGLQVGFQLAEYSMLILSRQLLVQAALEAGWTHILFIDSDMKFPRDLAVRLLRHRQPIVAANCLARRHPHYLTARLEDGSELRTGPESTGIEKVARAGTGVMLIHLDLFKTIPMPWFDHEWLPEKHIFRGEDFGFCDRARSHGFDIYVDHDVSKEVFHVGQFAYSPLHRDGFLEAQRLTEQAAAQAAAGSEVPK